MNELTKSTPVMSRDSKRANTIFTILAVLVALSMFVAASGSGSGNPAVEEPLPAWVDIGANVVSAIIGILVLLPKTRAVGAVAAAANMLLSMFVNYRVDGFDYFLYVLPYNIGTLAIALMLVWHYWEDLSYTFKSTSTGGRKSLNSYLGGVCPLGSLARSRLTEGRVGPRPFN